MSEACALGNRTDRPRALSLTTTAPGGRGRASQEQRNRLARLLFAEVRIRNHEVEALVPTPEFAPFFRLAGCEELSDGEEGADKKEDSPDTQGCPETLRGGSDGIRTRGLCLDRAAC